MSTLLVTHSECEPLLSESRYLCTSKIRFVVGPSGFVNENGDIGITTSVRSWVSDGSM